MSSYVCYFDASVKGKKSSCAYYIQYDGVCYDEGVFSSDYTNPDMAEANALFHLLEYLEQNIVIGSVVKIFGDAKSVIDRINSGIKEKYAEIVELYEKLRQMFTISIFFISRQFNKIAHALARGETVCKHKNATPLSSLNEMLLSDIIIPEKITPPATKNLIGHTDYFRYSGELIQQIHVSRRNRISRGYISYLILLESGIDRWNVVID